jgi:hypothetical protein
MTRTLTLSHIYSASSNTSSETDTSSGACSTGSFATDLALNATAVASSESSGTSQVSSKKAAQSLGDLLTHPFARRPPTRSSTAKSAATWRMVRERTGKRYVPLRFLAYEELPLTSLRCSGLRAPALERLSPSPGARPSPFNRSSFTTAPTFPTRSPPALSLSTMALRSRSALSSTTVRRPVSTSLQP